MRLVLIGILTTAALCACSQQPQAEQVRFEPASGQNGTWYKGNTHAHTLESDGDSPPEFVASWYKDHGYDFLVLSDHNVLVDPATLAHLVDSAFLLIPGEEVTSSFEDHAVHVNGLNLPRLVEPRTGQDVVSTIQANVDAIREVDGVPHINHPNFAWSFGADELRQVEGDRLLEIFNGHPLVHNVGGGGSPGLEQVWDALLTSGKRVYGIAVDDAHHFQGEFGAGRANPGRGWVSVRAPGLDALALMMSLEQGRFYASTGVELENVIVDPTSLEVHIAEQDGFRYTTTFIGSGGRVLATMPGTAAVFELTEDVGYVRAKIVDSMGSVAWTQPVFVEGD